MTTKLNVTADQFLQIMRLSEEIRCFHVERDPVDEDQAWKLGIKNILGVGLDAFQDLELIVRPVGAPSSVAITP